MIFRRTKGRTSLISGDSTAGERTLPKGRPERAQRYRCRVCRKTSNALTGAPMTSLRHKEKWLVYVEGLKDGMPVRKATERLGHKTTFRWRHRFPTKIRDAKDMTFQGIVESDEMVFLESCKGERTFRTVFCGIGAKKFRNAGCRKNRFPSGLFGTETAPLVPILPLILKGDALLCTDGALAYKAVPRECGTPISRSTLGKNSRWVRKCVHVQNVNTYSRRLKGWMKRVHGVATRYLPNYLGWRRLLEKATSSSQDFFERCLRLAIREFHPIKET